MHCGCLNRTNSYNNNYYYYHQGAGGPTSVEVDKVVLKGRWWIIIWPLQLAHIFAIYCRAAESILLEHRDNGLEGHFSSSKGSALVLSVNHRTVANVTVSSSSPRCMQFLGVLVRHKINCWTGLNKKRRCDEWFFEKKTAYDLYFWKLKFNSMQFRCAANS